MNGLLFFLLHILTCSEHSLNKLVFTLFSAVLSVFHQLAKINAEAQQVERELRDELAHSISKAASDADRAKIAELEKAEAELRVQVSKYV